MQASGKLYILLHRPWEQPPVAIAYEAGRAPESIRKLCRWNEKILLPYLGIEPRPLGR